MMPSVHNEKSSKATITSPQLMAYGVFLFSAGAVWHLVADGAFSSILTVSSMVQCLGATLLALKVLSSGSVSGISVRALALDALAISFRLSSTVWLNGYLPVDASGDHVYQVMDVCSFCVLAWILREALIVKQGTYQSESDNMPIVHMVVGSLVLAVLLHGNMNGRPVFDSLWLASVLVSAVAVLPQLWLITKTGGRVEALTSHYIAAMAVSRVLSGMFMWHARLDITCDPWLSTFNHTSFTILAAHFVQMVLLGDFAYYYVKAVLATGLNCSVQTLQDCGAFV